MNTLSNQMMGLSQYYASQAKDPRLDKKIDFLPKKDSKVDSETHVQDPQLTKKNDEIRTLSEEFESLFLGLVLKSMRDSVQKSGLIDGGNAENIYRSMLDDEYAKQMAAQHHTGLADQIADFLNGQSRLRGHKAYGPEGLPEGAKKATIGTEKKSLALSDTSPTLPPNPSRDVSLSKTP